MKTSVDQFGRVVIPKRVRDHFGLSSGAELEIQAQNDEIVLKPVRETSSLAVKDGVLVFTGQATADLTEAVRQQRELRTQHLARRARQ
jgi:AbrB family looped-hinge helix DNA binding protein